MKTTLRTLLLFILGLTLLIASSFARLWAAEEIIVDIEETEQELPSQPISEIDPRIRPERLWLPASAQHLRPYLVLAVERSLEDPDCVEMLYARLNEYRTVYDEPTFSILCQKDYKTTFNHIYRVSDLDEYYDERVAQSEQAAETSSQLSADIEQLRNSLLVPTDVIVNNAIPQAVSPEALEIEPPAGSPTGNRREEDPNDLSLDLDIDLDF